MMGLAMFVTLFALLLLGVPIAVCIGFSAIMGILTGPLPISPIVVGQRMFTAIDSFPFMAIPFFMLAGGLMEHGGISRRLVRFASVFVGWMRGGLGLITVVASAFFGAISGSNPATVAAIGGLMVPSMIKNGYKPAFAAANAAAAGTLGVVIPPSIPMITFGVVAGVSIGDLFIAGIIPGIVLAIMLCACTAFLSKKLGVPTTGEFKASEVAPAFMDAVWALFMPIIILGGIYSGVFTPTEAGAVASFYSLLVSIFVYREMNLEKLKKVIINAAVSTAIVFFVIAASQSFAWLLNVGKITEAVVNGMLSITASRYGLLLFINIILLVLGVFLETQAIILLVTPILLPIAMQVGLDPMVLGIIIIVNTSLGMITPPMAVNLFVAQGLVREYGVTLEQISRYIIPFFCVELGFVLLISYVPGIATGLVEFLR
ncbi:MAG: TRAP transporter large permease [Deltaproteobacteria bacterium]|jgi:C4-dicarboxylate transporter DctM subunit|nr:TRAP transporter large permease [Deltaproteobacteria bacterium]